MLTEFIEGGHYERHINKTRKIYKNRHDALILALKEFGSKIKIKGENAGMHLVVECNFGIHEEEIINMADSAGIKLIGLSKHRIVNEDIEGKIATLLIGYGNIGEGSIREGIETLCKLF